MGCNCGSGTGKALGALTRQGRQPVKGETWEVTFPNGDAQTFASEWQADYAIAMAGGRKRRITTGPEGAEKH